MAHDEQAARWIKALNPKGPPRYLQIADWIGEAVEAGLLRAGERLPPQRSLAERLDVDLTTVTRAYDEARRRNLLDAVTGRGSFVAAQRSQPGLTVDLSMNIPPAPRGLRLSDLVQRGIKEVLARTSVDLLMTYHVGPGSQADRAAGCTWLQPVLGRVDPERLVVCSGAQTALAAILSMLTRPGDAVLAEPLTYPGFLAAAAQCRLKVIPVETDAEGLKPDALDRACRESGSRVLYLIPTIQNPTTVTMPTGRRRDLVRVARANDLTIIEDDPYSLLAGDAPPPLATLAPERSWYVATVSKCLTPGLRTAYVALPERTGNDRLLGALRALTLMPAPLMTALVTHWIREGRAATLLTGVREEAIARQALARSILPPTMRAHPNGLHVWQPLPAPWDRHRLIETAREHGLGVTPADVFSASSPVPDAVRISLGGVGDRARLAEALRVLAAIMSNDQPAQRAIV